jgi:hypothetical protein
MANEKELFASLESKYRLPQGYLDRLYQIESSRGADLTNKNSTAKGPFQFTDRTAKAMGLEDPNDLAASADAAARLAVQNRTILQQNGVENPDGKMLYLAHQQGAGGALKLLQGGENPADKAVGAKAVTNNGGEKGDTSKGFVEQVFGKYEGADPETLKPYSALKTSEPLDQKAPDTLSVLEGDSEVAPEPRTTRRDSASMSALANLTKDLQPKQAPLLPIPDISKPQMEFAKGGLASIKKNMPPMQDALKTHEQLAKRLNFVPPGMPKGNPKTGLLFPPSIILQSMQAQGVSPEGATQALQYIAAAARAKKVKLVQLGNTVFVVTPKPDKSADILINTVEPRQLYVRIKALSVTLKHLGFRKMTTLVKPDEQSKAEILLDEAGIKYKKVPTEVSLQKGQKEKAFRYEVEV